MGNTMQLFQTALRSEPVSPELQVQALRFAQRTNSTELLVSLARLSELEPSVTDAIKKSTDLDVLRTWATQRGRDLDEVIARLRNEKRVTLLEGLAKTSGLPQELYDNFAARQSVNLSWALLDNASVDKATRLQVAGFLGQRSTRTDRRCYNEANDVSACGAEFLTAFVLENSNVTQLRYIAENLSDKDNADASAHTAIMRLVQLSIEGDRDAVSHLCAMTRRIDASATLTVLADAIGGALPVMRERNENDYERLVEAEAVARTRSQVKIEDILAPIRTAPDPAAIMQAVRDAQQTIRSHGFYAPTGDVAEYVLENPNINVSVLSEFRLHATPEQLKAIAERAVANKDRDLAILAMDSAGRWSYEDLVAYFHEQAQDPEEFMKWLLGSSETAPYCVMQSHMVQNDIELAYRLLPISNTIALPHVRDRIASALGSNQEAWDMFSTLADEWSGSVPDLLATVQSLTGSES